MAKKTSESKKKATRKKAAKKTATRKKKGVEPASRGLPATEIQADGAPPAALSSLEQAVARDGGQVLARYRDPLGGAWQLLAALPLDAVEPAPFQRDLSDAHVKKLEAVLDRLDRYLDPILVVRTEDGHYWTPNGHHRVAALQRLGARSVVALLVPELELAYQILALNTEKAPGIKERAQEVIRLARELARIAPAQESDYAVPFDEAALLTLGVAYEEKPRLSGSSYHPILKRCDGFLDAPLSEALEVREARAAALLEVDALVDEHVAALKERGFHSSYLKNFVVARINPLRGGRGEADFDETLAKMKAKAEAFDPSAVDAAAIGG